MHTHDQSAIQREPDIQREPAIDGEPRTRHGEAVVNTAERKKCDVDGRQRGRFPEPLAAGDLGFSLELIMERQSAIVRTKAGESLELPLAAWAAVLSELERKVAALPGLANDPEKPSFGPRPGRFGADWSAREMALLAKEYESGMAIAALALAHQRSTGAVEAQLVKLGLLSHGDCQYTPPRRY